MAIARPCSVRAPRLALVNRFGSECVLCDVGADVTARRTMLMSGLFLRLSQKARDWAKRYCFPA